MVDRSHYVAASERVLREAQKREKTYVGPCRECKYRRWAIEPGSNGICVNPLVILAARNQTDAYESARLQECSEQRDRESPWGTVVCGPDGTLFEPREGLSGWTLFLVAAMIPPLLWFLWRLI